MKRQFTRLTVSTLLFFLLIGTASVYGQNQIIGNFPAAAGSFEPLATGALGSSNSSTTWYQNSGGTVANIVTSSTQGSARTGTKFLTLPAQSNSGKYPVCPILLTFAPSTSYMVQFYYRTATATSNMSVSNYPDKNTGTLSLVNTSGGWTKTSRAISTVAAPTSPASIGFKLATAGTPLIDFDDFVVYAGTVQDDTAPDVATTPNATTTVATQMAVTWTAPVTGVDGGGYLVVRGTTDPTAVPNANGIYGIGSTVSDGVGNAGTVAYIGTNPFFTDLGLTQTTHYFYRIYTVDKAFNYSTTSAAADFTTTLPNYATEPITQVTNLSFTGVTSTALTLNWTAGDGINNLVLIKSGSAATVDPGDGNTYTASPVFGSGATIGTGNYVVYNGTGNSVTVTGLSKATTYYFKVYSFNGYGGTENYLITTPATGSQLAAPGEISSTGSNSAGVTWATATAWVGGVVPGPTDNVTIVAGDKIQMAASASCFNLTVQPGGKLYNNALVVGGTMVYLTVYGPSLTINGTLGDKNDLGTSDCAFGINYVSDLTFNGIGTIRPARLRPNTSTQNATLTINANMEMTYQGSSGTGGASIYTDNATNDNITITVNAGKTLSFVDYSNLCLTSSTSVNGTASTTINVNGTINMAGTHSYLALLIASGKTSTLNVNGTLNVVNLNATSGVATSGATPIINVGNGGAISVNGTADFSSPTLSATVNGTGTFNLNTGGYIRIAAPTGLEPVAGPVRTTTRTFDPAANYLYVGTATQATGSDLPAIVNSLTVNNTAGVALSAPTTLTSGITLSAGVFNNATNNITLGNGATVIVTAGSLAAVPVFGTTANLTYNGALAQTTSNELPSTAGVLNNLTVNDALGLSLGANSTVNGVLALTTGKLSLGANNLTVASTGSITGATATSYIVTDGIGKLTQSIGAGAARLFPVGASVTSYDPATLTPTDATDIAVNVGTTLPDVTPSNYTYNAKVWDISPVSPSSTVVALTPSTAVSTILRDVIGHYTGGAYDNVTATKSGNGYTATFSIFSPFVTGTTDLGTSLSNNLLEGVSFDGQIIHNNANVELRVFDATGRFMVSSNKNINMGNNSKGIYVVKSSTMTLKIALIK